MEKRQFILTLVLAIISAFIGGALSNRSILGRPAQAESPRIISAQEFRLLDSRGVIRGRLGTWPENQDTTYFGLNDNNGKRRITIKVNRHGNPLASFWDRRASSYGIDSNIPSIFFLDRYGKIHAKLPGRQPRGLQPIQSYLGGDGKADSAQLRDIRYLTNRINAICYELEEIRRRVNLLSQ